MYTCYTMLPVKMKYLENILIVIIVKKNYYYKYNVIKLKCCKLKFLNGRFTTIICFLNSQVECIYPTSHVKFFKFKLNVLYTNIV